MRVPKLIGVQVMSPKHESFKTVDGTNYKITAANFLGNIANDFGYSFTATHKDVELEYVIRLPREIASKKWNMTKREQNEKALEELGFALVKKQLNMGNEEDGKHIVITTKLAKKTVKETLKSLR